VRTITATVLPRRFWQSVHPAQPLVPRRLVAYAVTIVLLAALAPASRLVEAFTAFRFGRPSSAAGWQVFAPTWRVFASTARDALAMAWAVGGARDFLLAMGCYAVWATSTFGALLVFRVSMRRARIRPAHVGRCVVYSFDLGVWFGVAGVAWGLYNSFVAIVQRPGPASFQDELPFRIIGFFGLSVGVVTVRLAQAYRLYMRFDHAGWTVVAAQVIALLAALNALVIWEEWVRNWF